jgi:hypothetical protein
MTDAPFTETHRKILEHLTQGPTSEYLEPLDHDAIEAALAEIDRLTKDRDVWRAVALANAVKT